jgi:signal transduction histidine kinase
VASPSPATDGPSQDMRRHRRLGPGLAVTVALAQTLVTALVAGARLDLPGYALLACSGLVLTFRRRYPPVTVFAIAAMTVVYQARHYPGAPTLLALGIAVLVALASAKRREVWWTAIMAYAAWCAAVHPGAGHAVGVAAVTVGSLLFLEAPLGAARMAGQMSREQARAAEERRRRKQSEERLRIAQELHDVLGHHLSLIHLQAGVGRHLIDRQSDQPAAVLDTVKQTLDTIKQASAEALREVRTMLDTLYPTAEAAPLAPSPQLDRLVELTGNAGLPVRTTVTGTPRPLPASVDRAAYRIVQEALTNVRRHAGIGASATVTIAYRPDELLVEVDDDGGDVIGPPGVPVVDGNGTSGMRERATTLGGSLTAGPLPRGGWRVHARLPLAEPAAEAAA